MYEATLTKIESMIAQPNRVQLYMPGVWQYEKYDRYVKADLISHADVQFLRSRIAVAMRLQEFVGLDVDGNWRISSDESVNSLFNATSMRQCLQLLQDVNAADIILQTQDRLSILLGRSTISVSDDMWRKVALRIADPIYRDNSINTKTLLHFFFAYLMSEVQSGDYWKARGLFERRVRDLDSHLRAHVRCTPTFASNLWRKLAVTPAADFLKFGHVYYYDRTDVNDMAEVERFYAFFVDIADEIKGELASGFARRHFTELGFILTSDFQFPEIAQQRLITPSTLESVPANSLRPPMPPLTSKKPRIREFLPNFKYSDEFFVDYREYWRQLGNGLQIEASELISDIAGRFFAPEDDPERNSTIEFKKLNQHREKVGEGEEVNLSTLLENSFDRMVSYLIARRIMLGMSTEKNQRRHLALKLGFLAREDGDVTRGGKNFGTYAAKRCGLSMEDCRKPFRPESSVHRVVGEKEWLEKYRKPPAVSK